MKNQPDQGRDANKETDIGLVPAGWQVHPLAEFIEKPDYGFTASASSEPIGPKFLRITDIQDGTVKWDTVPYCSNQLPTIDQKVLRPNDIVVARIGATTGKAFLIDECPEAIFASYLIRIRTLGKKLSPKFLYYFLQTEAYWEHIHKYKDDRLKGGVNIPILTSLQIPLPPLSEQDAIAEILARTRKAISIEVTAESVAQDLKRATLRELFTRGLRGEAQKETEFGLVPETWQPIALNDCATVQTGVAKGRRFSDVEMVDVPYLRVANVQDGHLDLTEMKEIHIRRSEIERYRLQTGDVVLTEGGDFDKLGRGFIWRGELDLCVHQNHVFAVRPEKKRLLPEFFAYLAQSAYGKAYFLKVAHKTTNLACINSTKLKAFPVPIPPTLDEARDCCYPRCYRSQD
jgi:restriction endonuclease S subunit